MRRVLTNTSSPGFATESDLVSSMMISHNATPLSSNPKSFISILFKHTASWVGSWKQIALLIPFKYKGFE